MVFYYSYAKGWEFYETVINAFSLLTIRTDVKEALVENGITNVQYIPVIIEDIDTGEQNTDYYVVNFLTKLDAVNLDNSQFYYNPKYNSYSFLGNCIYFNSNIIDGVDIFIDIKASMSIFVSEKVKQIFKDNNWQTMNFTQLGLV
ncbi:imm11 family protein [Streptococcus acidominimus]|uniref:Immunity MXAN-0049 protein domain-containing protein n=1 Tax=Streptococcus acidominimus TaxID=1326 RepID=A0A1Q8EEJ5_STRAI|nr:DUF1629 domain-containing protein [Streptococcus acidominimus]OLF50218.1 hypothetical protein BU200_02910 [Streptococcus acidominimus]SUN06681.1 Uncharacterised protein [Streptococcus acidominimus]